MNTRRQPIFIKTCCAGLLLAGLGIHGFEQRFWEKQDESTWTKQQISQFATSSPWAKTVTAVLVTNDSNMVSSPSRGGGRGRASRSDSTIPQPSELPKFQAVVQWVSAKPMRQILRLHLPPSFDGRYVVCVSGLPLSGDVNEVAEATTLQVKRGDLVHPEAAYQDPNDTSAIYFGFLPSTVDVSGSKTLLFNMVAEPYSVRTKFNIGEMKYLGEPAL